MTSYIPPLSVIFVWHPADATTVKPIIDHCFSLLSRDVEKAFSRSMNLPIFYRTSSKKEVPTKIEEVSEKTKTIVFTFVSYHVVADESWIAYLKDIPRTENVIIIPIALDKLSLTLSNEFDDKNFIRAYDYDQAFINDYIFVAITHEIYRYALNETFSKMVRGKDNALKIFLSHAKDGKSGIKLAKALKNFIDNSSMRNFFDATDIAPGYKFDEEIIEHIKKSSVIAIHSDAYSSRYWCQREILCAKENNRPIIAVDTLEEFEDRRFPFASNIPGVHITLNGEPTIKDLLRILSSTLLETVRFFYAKLLLEQYKHAGWIKPDAELRSRPPEVSDIDKILFDDGNSIRCKYKALVYPDPPLYSEELSFLTKLGIQISTPLTLNLSSLQGKYIGISISEPSEEELISIGQSRDHLIQLSQDIARQLLTRGATLIYGGDLRENGFTEFIFNEAHALRARLQSKNIHLINYIAWPIYKNDTVDVAMWKAKYKDIVMMEKIEPPANIKDLIPNEDTFLPPINSQNLFVWSRCLTKMRNEMIEKCDVRICAGGKLSGYKGRIPGVLEEIILAIEKKRPLFLLGGFGGVTASVCKYLQNNTIPLELTLDWQIQNNSGYKELLDFYSSREGNYSPDYSSLMKSLKIENLKNGLSLEDNYSLFKTPFIDEAVHLILKGLKSVYGASKLS